MKPRTNPGDRVELLRDFSRSTGEVLALAGEIGTVLHVRRRILDVKTDNGVQVHSFKRDFKLTSAAIAQ